eukprot:Hpha_TRINITY_DN8941_c0_g1::TRINITY_DN8941_c0_g1_i1::g.81000::m.81000/K04936/KCNMA1; potassium large conductance calcium-activated channel subfamily M alpha member 1
MSTVVPPLAFQQGRSGDGSVFTAPRAYPAPELQGDDGFRSELSLKWSAGDLGRRWDSATLFFAILSAIVYVVEVYINSSTIPLWSKIVELCVATFFGTDYLVRFFLAEHRIRFAFQATSVLDILCILPVVFIWLLAEGRKSQSESADPEKVVFFLQFLRVTRLVRVLRGYRVVSVSKRGDPDYLSKQIQILIYTLVALIFVTAALLHLVEQYATIPSLDREKGDLHIEHFHDAVYFVVITLTTVGYGDFVPRTIVARVIVMFFVVTSVVLIPRETGKLAELMALTSPYAGSFRNQEKRPHVVVFGHIEFQNFKAFLTEFFHEAHGTHKTIVIAMSPKSPSRGLKLLCGEKGYYGTRVQYFEGSALEPSDLRRIRYTEACACFLLADRLTVDKSLTDCETVMRTLSVKQIAPKVPVYAQVLLPESKPQLITAGADHFVCITELKMHILATASMVHGFSTLFCNLFRNEEFVFSAEDHWLGEYCHGISYEIYCFDIPDAFLGRTFAEVACFVYSEFDALIFGVRKMFRRGAAPVCLLNPCTTDGGFEYTFSKGDKAFIFATDAEVSETVAAFTGDFSVDIPDVLTELETMSPTKVSENMRQRRASVAGERPHVPETLRSQTGGRKVDKSEFKLGVNITGVPGDEAREMPPLVPLHPPHTYSVDQQQEPGSMLFDKDDASSDVSDQEYGFRPRTKYEKRVLNDVPRDMRGHIIIVSNAPRFLTNFAAVLRTESSGKKELRPIVALIPQVPEESVLRALYSFKHVYFIVGNPSDVGDLRRCNVRHAHTCLILFSGSIGGSPVFEALDQGDDGEDKMADYDGLLAYTCLSSEIARYQRPGVPEENPFCILELIHRTNTRFIPPRPEDRFGEINEANDYIVPCYAGGLVFSDAVMDSLLCQVFYNPELLGVLSQFLCPDPLPAVWPQKARPLHGGSIRDNSLNTPSARSPSQSKDPRTAFRSSRIYSMPIRRDFVGRKFGDILTYMLLHESQLPIGLFRAPDRLRQGFFTAGAGGAVPFVFLCPPPGTILKKRDKIFVLAGSDPNHSPVSSPTGRQSPTQ